MVRQVEAASETTISLRCLRVGPLMPSTSWVASSSSSRAFGSFWDSSSSRFISSAVIEVWPHLVSGAAEKILVSSRFASKARVSERAAWTVCFWGHRSAEVPKIAGSTAVGVADQDVSAFSLSSGLKLLRDAAGQE